MEKYGLSPNPTQTYSPHPVQFFVLFLRTQKRYWFKRPTFSIFCTLSQYKETVCFKSREQFIDPRVPTQFDKIGTEQQQQQQ